MSKRRVLFTLIVITSLQCTATIAKDFVVALSPYQSAEQAKQQVTLLLKFMTALDPGVNAVLMDGYHLRTLGTFTVPEGKRYQSPKARIAKNRAVAGALIQFAKKARKPTGNDEPSVSQAVRLPQLLRSIAETMAPQNTLDVIVLGSPLYDDPKDTGYSMADGLFPSDGHLTLSRGKTPFGAADNPALLKNIRVHLGFDNEAFFPTDQHRFYIKRFWTLFVEAQAGSLVSFTGNLPDLFRQVIRDLPAPGHNHTITKEQKLEMIRLRREEVTQTIQERPISTRAIRKHLVKHAQSVEIGLTWQCERCDLDLYAAPYPGAEILFYGHTQSSEGEHYKDFRHSPQRTESYETIAFHMPVDLRKLTIVVSFYAGNAPQGVTGELRLSVDGQTFAHTFHLSATSGNKGKNLGDVVQAGRSDNTHVALIDPLQVVGLR